MEKLGGIYWWKDVEFEVSLVLDASTALSAALPDEFSAFGRAAVSAALREGLIVPILWLYEIQNGLAMALRRKRIDARVADEALLALRGLGALVEPPKGFGEELQLACTLGLTAYDAAYLTVAINAGARLATCDRQLQKAAKRVGIMLFS